jgi:hypothetical protein
MGNADVATSLKAQTNAPQPRVPIVHNMEPAQGFSGFHYTQQGSAPATCSASTVLKSEAFVRTLERVFCISALM